MNDRPTSGPITTSSTQYARDAISSRHSLANSHTSGAWLGERKECLFQRAGAGAGGQLIERALAADRPAAQQHEAVAHAGGVADLMDRQHQCAAVARKRSQRRRHLASL